MAKKKPGKKATAKQPAKRQSTAKKPAKKAAAKKAAPKAAAKKAAAKKAAPKAAAKSPSRAAPKSAAPKARRPAPRKKEAVISERYESEAQEGEEETEGEEEEQVVETTSAGIQPLAPEHAAVDDLTSTGNELLDIFQKYDRNRTGFIEAPEFARLLEALGQNITDEDLQIAFDVIDIDRSGKISWKQFKNWWTSR